MRFEIYSFPLQIFISAKPSHYDARLENTEVGSEWERRRTRGGWNGGKKTYQMNKIIHKSRLHRWRCLSNVHPPLFTIGRKVFLLCRARTENRDPRAKGKRRESQGNSSFLYSLPLFALSFISQESQNSTLLTWEPVKKFLLLGKQ
jgi:hypothetical protein